MDAGQISKREQEVLNGIVAVVRELLDPDRILLFGSRAQTDASSRSDFDIAVSGEACSLDILRDIKQRLEPIAGLYKYDIVFLDAIEPVFKEQVEKTGKIIYER